MRYLGLPFDSLVNFLASFSRSWGGSEEILTVLGSVKGHEMWRVLEMRRSSLRRGEKWWGYKGVRGL